MIKKTKRRIEYEVTERWHCDVCDTPMKTTGVTYLTSPAKYEHVCPNCGAKEALSGMYPRTTIIYGKEEKYDE